MCSQSESNRRKGERDMPHQMRVCFVEAMGEVQAEVEGGNEREVKKSKKETRITTLVIDGLLAACRASC